MINQTSSLEFSHFPVMLNEVLKISLPSSKKKIIDCTFGGGGYSKAILNLSGATVQAIDRDKKVSPIAKKFEKEFPKRFKFDQIKFSQLDTISDEFVDVVIFDLGLSSIQLDDYDRGFSFKSKKKLNMTMGLNEITALEAINNLSETDLKQIIKILGNEQEAFRIAKEEMKDDNKKIAKLSKTFWKKISSIPEIFLNGSLDNKVPNIINVSFAYIEGESLIMALKDVAVSSGSACTSASLEPSYVLRALGRADELAHSSIRFSFGRFTTEEEVLQVAETAIRVVKQLRDLSPLWDMFLDGVDLEKVEWAPH